MSIQVRSNEKPTPPATVVEPSAVEKPAETQPERGAPSPSAAQDTQVPEQKDDSVSETENVEPKEELKDEEPKKKGGFQRRIDKLNAQKAQAQQEAEYWKQLAIKNAGEMSKHPKSPLAIPAGKPNPEDFQTHSEYVESLTDWKTEQKLNERDQKNQKEKIDQDQAKAAESYQTRMKAFAEKNPDYQDVVAEVDHIPISPAMRDVFLNSENGPELAYELAKLPEEFERIAKLPPLAAARELGKFEARLSPPSKSTNERNNKKITQAPKPIEPVGTGGKGSVPKSIFDPNLSQSEYEALRREQMKKRRQAG